MHFLAIFGAIALCRRQEMGCPRMAPILIVVFCGSARALQSHRMLPAVTYPRPVVRFSNSQQAMVMSEPWGAFGVLSGSSAVAQWLGKNTRLGRLLSAPICAMLCTFVGASSGILPAADAHVISVQSMAVKLALSLIHI